MILNEIVASRLEETEKYKELIFKEAIQRTNLINQEKFSVIAHDINSPLCTLKIMIDLCDELPEEKRNILRRATESIVDIVNNLISNNQIIHHYDDIQTELHKGQWPHSCKKYHLFDQNAKKLDW